MRPDVEDSEDAPMAPLVDGFVRSADYFRSGTIYFLLQ
jgi:hypothetical protein